MHEKDRLATIMQKEGINARQFAERVGIQPATMSNILNGRNNPSLDVLQRVIYAFPTISPEWMFVGNGSMYRSIDGQPTLFDMEINAKEPQQSDETAARDISVRKENSTKNIQKVVIFYSDGTFKEII